MMDEIKWEVMQEGDYTRCYADGKLVGLVLRRTNADYRVFRSIELARMQDCASAVTYLHDAQLLHKSLNPKLNPSVVLTDED